MSSARTDKRECDCLHRTHEHGTRRMYAMHKCGCFSCRLANSQSEAIYRAGGSHRQRLIDPAGTVRRLQALSAIGVGRREIAARLGVTERAVQYFRNCTTQVNVETARKVAAIYDELWNAQRTGRGATCAKRRAAAQGWLPPLAWDDDTIDDPEAEPVEPSDAGGLDEVLVERLVAGDHMLGAYTRVPERFEAIRRLAALGHPDRVIGERVHMTKDAVTQARLRHGIPAGVPSCREGAAA